MSSWPPSAFGSSWGRRGSESGELECCCDRWGGVPGSQAKEAERQKEAKRRVELRKKQQERTRREVSTGNNAKKDPKKARQQLADVKKKNAKEQARAAKQRAAKFKEEAKIARIKEDKRRLAQGKKVRSRSGLGFFQTVLLVGGVGTAALVLAPDENSADGAPPAPVEDAAPAEAVEETAA